MGGGQQTDKAAVLSCQREVFQLSLGKQLRTEGERGGFVAAELRVNSIFWKTTTILPDQKALLKMQSLALSVSRKYKPVFKSRMHYMRHYATQITCLNTSRDSAESHN